MQNILAIMRTTYSRVASSKSLYLLWLILVGLIAAMNRYGELSMGRHKILMVDLGLILVSLVAAGSVLMVCGDIPRELRQRIAENLLSKPVGRDQYLIGKLLGTLLFTVVNVLLVSLGFCAVLTLTNEEPRLIVMQVLQPLVGTLGMALILSAAAVFFGTFLSEVPAVVATFMVFWLGHSTAGILKHTQDAGLWLRSVGKVIYGVMPNLSLLNINDIASQGMYHDWPVPTWQYVGVSVLYGFLYASVLFAAALLVFRTRDI